MLKKKFNILYHFRVRGIGAEGVHIAGIVNGFKSMGHNVFLISPTNVDPTKEYYKVSKSEGLIPKKTFYLHKFADILPQPIFELMEVSYNFYAFIRLIKEINKNNIDFIYERYSFFNIAGALIAKLNNIPFILEVNELSGHKRIRNQSFIGLCSLIEKFILRQSLIVITVSDFLNKEVNKKINKNNTKVVTIPNGVPLIWFNQKITPDKTYELRERYFLHGKKIICFVGGLVHWHNFELLLKAVRDVQNEINNVALMIIGDGPLRNYIKKCSEKLSFQKESLVIVGKISHSEVPAYLKIADIAVIPETNDFRSPIKMFEYMAMGKAVVAPQKKAIETIISNNKDGILFQPGNSFDLSKVLLKCLSEMGFTNRIGDNARKKIKKYYTWERHAEHILHIATNTIDANGITKKNGTKYA